MFKLLNLLGARYSVLGLLCFLLTDSNISAQVEECGVPDMTYTEWQTVLSGCSNPQVAGSATWDIPIWITLVRQSTGYSSLDASFSPLQIVEEVNGYFNNGMHFYVCGITYIKSDIYYNLNLFTELPNLETDVHNLNPTEYPKGYIDVFFVGGGIAQGFAGYTYKPSGSYRGSIQMTELNGNTLAHELGHYFGLPHSYQGGKDAQTPAHPEWSQYVHHPTTPELFPVVLSTGTFGCDETGDFICDTPADPGQCSVNVPQCNYIICPPLYANDLFNLPYSPDRTLLMGKGGCRNRFSTQQNQIMVGMLTGHPDWAFLFDGDVPTCQVLPYDRGLVIRNCDGVKISDLDAAPPETPMEELGLSMQNNSNFLCGDITDKDGIYQTFPCLNSPPYSSADLLSLLPDVDYISPLIGVTTYDLVLISKHILGLESFENPFQIIAADVNNSGSITTFDIVELRKLIIGTYLHLPNNSNFRYVPDYCFEDNAFYLNFYDPNNVAVNPFDAKWTNPDEPTAIPPATNERSYLGGGVTPNATSWMDHVSINPYAPVAINSAIPWSFTGIKVGDVNCSASLPFAPEDPDKFFTTLSHSPLNTNQIFTLYIKALGNTPVSAWQLGIDFAEDSLEILQIQSGNTSETFSLDNFGLSETESGKLRALNFSETGTGQNLNDKTLFKIVIKALKPIANIGQHFHLKNSVLSEKFYATDGDELENIALYLEVVNGFSGLGMTSGIENAQKEISLVAYHVSAYPVPFTSEISFDFFLPKDEQVHLSIFDSFGRLIAERFETLIEGQNSLKVEDISKAPPALYWYSFEADGHTFFGKIFKN